MELSLTTFILESINFLVLIWILKRLFYAPVKKVIEGRKLEVAKTIKDATELKRRADELQTQYTGRLQAWEEEKAKAHMELEKELAEERARRLKQIEQALEAEREKMRAQEERKAADERLRLEHEAMKQSLEFGSRLLAGFASAELEAQILKMALERLHGLKATLEGNPNTNNPAYVVKTGFPLSDAQKTLIQDAIRSELGLAPRIEFSTEKALIAGVEIVLGATVLRANLRDELSSFGEARLS